jgi:RNA polymerase sigma factor (sigma-70 family)
MTESRVPSLTQEECDRLIQAIREGTAQADALVSQLADYCRRIAIQAITQGRIQPPRTEKKIYLPLKVPREWIDDIVQDSMLTLFRNAKDGEFRCRGDQITSYLFSVVGNQTLNLAKKLAKQAERDVSGIDPDLFPGDPRVAAKKSPRKTGAPDPTDDEGEQSDHGPAEPEEAESDGEQPTRRMLNEPRPTPDSVFDLVAAAELRAEIRRCAELLSPSQRQVLALLVRGDKNKEMALRLGVTPARVTGLQGEVRARLSNCLGYRLPLI